MNEQEMEQAIAEAKALVDKTRAENNAIIEGLKNITHGELLRSPEKSGLETTLEKMSTENRFTILPPAERVRKETQKFKDNMAKLECVVLLSDEEKKFMPKHQREAFERAEQERLAPLARTEIPSCFMSQASMKNGPLELEIVCR
jgi:hypothetical protein